MPTVAPKESAKMYMNKEKGAVHIDIEKYLMDPDATEEDVIHILSTLEIFSKKIKEWGMDVYLKASHVVGVKESQNPCPLEVHWGYHLPHQEYPSVLWFGPEDNLWTIS